MHREFVIEARVPMAKLIGGLEESLLVLRRGGLGCLTVQLRRSLALLAMMIGEEHPLDLLHADLRQMLQHGAIAQIDEQGAAIMLQHINVAGVPP